MRNKRGILPKEQDLNTGSELGILFSILVLSSAFVSVFIWLIVHELSIMFSYVNI